MYHEPYYIGREDSPVHITSNENYYKLHTYGKSTCQESTEYSIRQIPKAVGSNEEGNRMIKGFHCILCPVCHKK